MVVAEVFAVCSTVLNVVVICFHDHGYHGWNVPDWLTSIIFTKLAKLVRYEKKVALYLITSEEVSADERLSTGEVMCICRKYVYMQKLCVYAEIICICRNYMYM